MNSRYLLTIVAYLVVSGVFVLVATYAILFASGYRLDLTTLKAEKTGILSVDSNPDNAEILVAGKSLKRNTPASLKYILPGYYSVEVRMDGTHAYRNNTVRIQPGLVTDLRKILLFSQTTEKLTELGDVSAARLSWQNDRAFAFQSGTKLFYTSLDEVKPVLIADLATVKIGSRPQNFAKWTIKEWVMSPDHKSLVLRLLSGRQEQNLYIPTFGPNAGQLLPQLTGAEKIFWQGNNQLAYKLKAKLSSLSLRDSKVTPIATEQEPFDFMQFGDRTYYTTRLPDNTVNMHEIGGRLVKADLPLGDSYQIYLLDPLVIKVSTTTAHTVWVLPNDSSQWTRVAGNVTYAQIYDESIVYQTDKEVAAFRLHPKDEVDAEPKTLVTAIDKDSRLLIRHDYLFYLSGRKLTAVSFTGSEPVTLTDDMADFWLDSEAILSYGISGNKIAVTRIRDAKRSPALIRDLLLRYKTESL